MADPPTGFGMNAAMTGSTVVSVNDGGWSSGMAVKGSGWRNLAGATTPIEGPSWAESGGGSGPSPDVGSSGWGEDPGANSLEKKSGSGWFSAESGANRPSSIGTDGWKAKPPRQGPPSYGNERGAWNKGQDVGQSLEGLANVGEEKRGHESGGMNGVSIWGANKPPRDVVCTNWKVLKDSDDRRSEYSTDMYSPPKEDCPNMEPSGQRKPEADVDRSSQSSNEVHGFSGHSQESYRGVNSSPAAFESSDTVSLGSASATSHSDYQSSGNFSSSRDSHVTRSDSADAHHGGFESPYSRISPQNGAGTPAVQLGSRNGGATPTQGGRGDNFWVQGRVGSSSSMSSVGSSSSWKGDSKNGSGPGFQGRRNSRSV